MQQKVLAAYRRITEAFRGQGVQHCLKCDHTWKARLGTRPQKCPGCGSGVWDQPSVRWAWSSSYRHTIDRSGAMGASANRF
jgi:hypothetical protein